MKQTENLLIKKTIYFTLIFLLAVFKTSVFSGFSAEKINLEGSNGSIDSYVLENGLSLFSKEDNSVALVRIEAVVKAGYSSSSRESQSLLTLQSKLLEKNISKTLKKAGLVQSMNADSITFTLSCPREQTEEILNELAEHLQKGSSGKQFTDRDINEKKDELISVWKEGKGNAASFINRTIDSVIFCKSPWKEESLENPSWLENKKAQEIRKLLKENSLRFYTPDSTAVFISGCISSKDSLALLEKTFSSWKGRRMEYKEKDFFPDENKGRKFVLVHKDFSKDMVQLVLEWTSLSLSQSDIFSWIFNRTPTLYNILLNDTRTGLRSREYVYTSSAEKNARSRLISQALLEPSLSSEENKINMVKSFCEDITKAADFDRQTFINAQNAVIAKYRSKMGNSGDCMALLADFWALSSYFTESDFYESFLNFSYSAQNQNIKETKNALKNEEPYIFVLIDTDTFEKEKENFKKEKYVFLDEKNLSAFIESYAPEKKDEMKIQNEEKTLSTLSSADSYYRSNAPLIHSYTLANGIPLTVKKNPQTENAAIMLEISGGEYESPEDEKMLRTVLVNAFASNIQSEINLLRKEHAFKGETYLTAQTKEFSSSIILKCAKDDIKSCLEAMSNAVIFGEIPPSVADTLVREQYYQHSMKISPITYQLKAKASSFLAEKNSIKKLFSLSKDILQKTDYFSISKNYINLLDASLYTLVITGNFEEESLVQNAEETFGVLKEINKREIQRNFSLKTKKRTVSFPLTHTFTTEKTKEEASEESPLLVPTKDFSDPVAVFFDMPDENKDRALFEALTYELTSRTAEKLEMEESLFQCGQVWQKIDLAMILCEKIRQPDLFFKAFEESVKELKEELSFPEKNKALLSSIKSTWIKKEMKLTSTNEGTCSLIMKGEREGNPLLYLEEYSFVANAGFKDFSYVLEKYFENASILKVLSKDSLQ